MVTRKLCFFYRNLLFILYYIDYVIYFFYKYLLSISIRQDVIAKQESINGVLLPAELYYSATLYYVGRLIIYLFNLCVR